MLRASYKPLRRPAAQQMLHATNIHLLIGEEKYKIGRPCSTRADEESRHQKEGHTRTCQHFHTGLQQLRHVSVLQTTPLFSMRMRISWYRDYIHFGCCSNFRPHFGEVHNSMPLHFIITITNCGKINSIFVEDTNYWRPLTSGVRYFVHVSRA